MIPQINARRRRTTAHMKKKQPYQGTVQYRSATPPSYFPATELTLNRDGSDWMYVDKVGLTAVMSGQTGLPVTPNGGDITLAPAAGGIYVI